MTCQIIAATTHGTGPAQALIMMTTAPPQHRSTIRALSDRGVVGRGGAHLQGVGGVPQTRKNVGD
eukprot:COSAG01_NODE_909_length_12785_cov_4.201876_18_plen_65_part_00